MANGEGGWHGSQVATLLLSGLPSSPRACTPEAWQTILRAQVALLRVNPREVLGTVLGKELRAFPAP